MIARSRARRTTARATTPPCAGRRGTPPARLIAGASGLCGNRAREIGQHQAFGAVGDIGERQRLAGFEEIGGRTAHAARISVAFGIVAHAPEAKRVS